MISVIVSSGTVHYFFRGEMGRVSNFQGHELFFLIFTNVIKSPKKFKAAVKKKTASYPNCSIS